MNSITQKCQELLATFSHFANIQYTNSLSGAYFFNTQEDRQYYLSPKDNHLDGLPPFMNKKAPP